MIKKRFWTVLTLLVLCYTYSALASPLITYENPTSPHNTYLNINKTFQINISIVEPALRKLTFSWNASSPTSYDYYSHSLILLLNLNNRSSLFENSSYVADSSIYNLTSVSTNVTNYTLSGRYESAFDFDGVDDYLNISNNINLTGRNLTASLWMKRDTTKNCAGILGKGDLTTTKGFAIYEGQSCGGSSGQLKFLIGNGSTFGDIYTRSVLSNNRWYHVAFRFDGNFSVFVDGNLENNTATIVSRMADDPAPFYLGTNSWAGTQFYDGLVDEVHVWNRSLSNQEIYQEFTTNIERYNQTQWYVFINQSKNTTNELNNGSYAHTFDAFNNLNAQGSIETRIITIGSNPALAPEWNNLAIFAILIITIGGYLYRSKKE